MPLTPETGSIIAGADSYVEVAEADSYHLERGNTAWETASPLEKEAAIRQATQFVDYQWLPRWKGVRVSTLQNRQWPRWGVVVRAVEGWSTSGSGYLPTDAIPLPIKHASCELALRALSGALAPDLPRGGRVIRTKVDVLETQYSPNAPASTVYQFVEMLLGDLLESASTCELVRS